MFAIFDSATAHPDIESLEEAQQEALKPYGNPAGSWIWEGEKWVFLPEWSALADLGWKLPTCEIWRQE